MTATAIQSAEEKAIKLLESRARSLLKARDRVSGPMSDLMVGALEEAAGILQDVAAQARAPEVQE